MRYPWEGQSGSTRSGEIIMVVFQSSGPFVGRQRELAELLRRLDSARAGHGSVVLVGGEPGIGKTRLAQQLATTAESQGCHVLWGRCWEADIGAPAYWPWIEALGGHVQTLDPAVVRAALLGGATDVAQLVPEVAALLPDLPAAEAVDPEQARFRLFGAITEFLRRIAAPAGPTTTQTAHQSIGPDDAGPDAGSPDATALVVVLEDLQWADRASLLLLHYVARELAGIPLLLLGTYQDTALDRAHPLTAALATLPHERTGERIELHGLEEREVQALIEGQVTPPLGPLGPSLAGVLYRETEGNPFFVGETLSHVIERGWLHQRDGRWVLTVRGIAELGLPVSVRDAIDHRLSRLSEDTRGVLGVAAVIGRDFDAVMLEQAAALDGEQVDRALQEAEQAGVIAAAGRGDRYRFGSALLRETLYVELATRRRLRLHHRFGTALEAHYGDRAEQHAAELAYHFGRAGEVANAILYSRLAGEQAEATTAWEEAARHYEQCLSLLEEGEGGRDAAEPALLVALGRCYRNADEHRRAWRCLLRAIARYEEENDGHGVARATIEALRIPAPPDRRDALARRALAALGNQDPHLEAQLLLHRTVWTEAVDGGAPSRRRAAELAERHGFADIEPVLAGREGNRALQSGRPDEARRIFERLHHTCAGLGKKGWALTFLVSASAIPLFAGALDEGETGIDRALDYARDVQNRIREAGLLTWLAGTALARGDIERYEAVLDQAETANFANFAVEHLRAVRHEIAGDLEGAVSLMPAPRLTGRLPAWLTLVHGGRARIRFHAGDIEGAREELALWERSWVSLRNTDGTPGYLHTLTCLDDALPALGRERLVGMVYAELRRWSWARFGPANASGIDQLRGSLALRLGQVDAAESHYAAGLEWAESEGCPVEAGRCLLGRAEVAAQRGQHAEAVAWLERAGDLLRLHGAHLYLRQVVERTEQIAARPIGEPRPAPAPRSTAHPDGLSEREVDVLRLIAAGKTNQEIAGLLTISPNTVARHITHILVKSGAANRAEAASYGHRHGLI